MFLLINLHCRIFMTKTYVKQERTLNVTKNPPLLKDFHWLIVVHKANMKILLSIILPHRDMITELTDLLLMVHDY
jgi:hypothetical protein